MLEETELIKAERFGDRYWLYLYVFNVILVPVIISGGFGVLLDRCTQFKSVHVGHHDIHEKEVKRLLCDGGERLRAGSCERKADSAVL